jgi:hypothetical protein
MPLKFDRLHEFARVVDALTANQFTDRGLAALPFLPSVFFPIWHVRRATSARTRWPMC